MCCPRVGLRVLAWMRNACSVDGFCFPWKQSFVLKPIHRGWTRICCSIAGSCPICCYHTGDISVNISIFIQVQKLPCQLFGLPTNPEESEPSRTSYRTNDPVCCFFPNLLLCKQGLKNRWSQRLHVFLRVGAHKQAAQSVVFPKA